MKEGYLQTICKHYRKRATMEKEVLAKGTPVDTPKGLPERKHKNSNGDETPDTDEIPQGYEANGDSDAMVTGSGDGPEY